MFKLQYFDGKSSPKSTFHLNSLDLIERYACKLGFMGCNYRNGSYYYYSMQDRSAKLLIVSPIDN